MYTNLPLLEIVPNPNQPRRTFDPDQLAELADSIRTNGLLEPVIVRPAANKKHELIAGERRWRAAIAAGLHTIAARVIEGLDDEAAFVLAVAENVNRADMNPIEEAAAFARLLDYGRTRDEVADLFGKTRRLIDQRLALLDLTDELQGLVADGTIGTQVATQVATCSPGNQQALMFKLVRGDFVNDNEAIHYAFALRHAESQTTMFDVDEPTSEQRARREKQRRTAADLLARLETGIQKLGDLTPDDLAAALGPEAHAFTERLDYAARLLTKARFNARQAKALNEARAHVVSSNPAIQTG